MNRRLRIGIVTVTMVVVLGAGCALTQRPTAQEDKARWKNAVNLLALVDPAKDTKGGKWENKDGTLVSNNKWGAHIQIPYQPPEEYDYRVCFTKLKPEGKLDGLNLWLPRSGRTVAWCIGGWGNTISGLEFVKGVNPSKAKNPTGVKRDALLEVGRRHTVIVKVRKNSVMGYLDGRLLTKWKGDWKDLSFPEWVSRTQLEIATYSATVFHSIEVLDVTGKGTLTRKTAPLIESTLEVISILVAQQPTSRFRQLSTRHTLTLLLYRGARRNEKGYYAVCIRCYLGDLCFDAHRRNISRWEGHQFLQRHPRSNQPVG
jgi:hypothetical protein